MKSKELADKLDAEDRLKKRGFVKRKCSYCDGVGTRGAMGLLCIPCKGAGFHWNAPITR